MSWRIRSAAAIAACVACGSAPEVPAPSPGPPDDAVHSVALPDSEWAGSTSCRDCHPDEHAAWVGSHHQRAERAIEPALDPGLVDGHLPSAEGQLGPRAARAIGVHPLVQYLVEAPGGRLQTYDLAWDVDRGEWFDVFEGDPRRAGDWGHWTGRALNWNSMCATCHDTNVVVGWDADSDSYSTELLEHGVGCEACHGPSAAHAASPARLP